MSGTAHGETDAAFARVAAFTSEIPRLPWFGAVGTKLTPPLVAAAETYVAALGLVPCAVTSVAGWRDAAAIAQRPDWSRAWWRAESAREQSLQRRGTARLGVEPLLVALTEITEISVGLRDHAAAALARAGLDDEALAKVASGAAAQACHQQGLALLAGEEAGQAFAAKYELFAAGRWLLGIVGGTCFVF